MVSNNKNCDPVCKKGTSGELSHFIVHHKTSKNHYSGEKSFFAFYYSPVNMLSIDILPTLLIVFFPMFTLRFSPTFLKSCFGCVIFFNRVFLELLCFDVLVF